MSSFLKNVTSVFKKKGESSDELLTDDSLKTTLETNENGETTPVEPFSDDVVLKEEESPTAAYSWNKRKIGAYISGALGVCVLASSIGYFMPKEDVKKADETVSTSASAATSNPAGNLPDKYSDIAKAHGTKSNTETTEHTVATNTASTNTQVKPADSSTANVNYANQPTAQVNQAELEAQRLAAEAAKQDEKYRQEVITSPIAFKIAADIAQGKSPAQASADAKGDPNAAPYDTTSGATLSPRYLTDTNYISNTNSHVLHAGTVIQATMLTGISTDIPNNEIVAVVRQNIYDSMTGTKLLIPQGSKIIGKAGSQGGKGIKRIGVTFSRIILPNGNSISLPNIPAIDGTGMPGMEDKYDTHTNSLFKTAFMSSLVTAVAQSATGDTGGSDTRSPGQEAVSGAVSQIADAASKLIDQAAQTQATIEIRPGKAFSMFVTQDLYIPEYTSDYTK